MLGDEEYRRLRDLARRDRDNEIYDLGRMLADVDVDSPGKRARTSRVHSKFFWYVVCGLGPAHPQRWNLSVYTR
jgi:hypothetical protein